MLKKLLATISDANTCFGFSSKKRICLSFLVFVAASVSLSEGEIKNKAVSTHDTSPERAIRRKIIINTLSSVPNYGKEKEYNKL